MNNLIIINPHDATDVAGLRVWLLPFLFSHTCLPQPLILGLGMGGGGVPIRRALSLLSGCWALGLPRAVKAFLAKTSKDAGTLLWVELCPVPPYPPDFQYL